jgi:hypothetical protein
LTRRDPAIRDFLDLERALSNGDVNIHDTALIEMLQQKLMVPGNESIDVSPAKLASLRSQLTTHLKPVLRDKDYSRFDLEKAFRSVAEFASRL